MSLCYNECEIKTLIIKQTFVGTAIISLCVAPSFVCPLSVVKIQTFSFWTNVNQLPCENREEQFHKKVEGNGRSVKHTAASSVKGLEHCCFTIGRGPGIAVCVVFGCVSGCQQGTSPSNFKAVICHLVSKTQPAGPVRESGRRERNADN